MDDKTPLDRIREILAPDANLTEGREVIASVCGVTRQAVEQWEQNGIPGRHVIALETVCKHRVTIREMLDWSLLKRRKAAA
jgi:hypothetical protein